MNNTCVSHLLIPESDRIQIVVSRVGTGGRSGGTDITVTTMNRNNRIRGTMGNRKLPPIMLPGERGDSDGSQQRTLSPSTSRIPSPSRRSSVTSLGRSNASSGISSVSVPASPTYAAPTSRYHQGCYIPQSASSPSAFPPLGSVNNYSSGIPLPQNSRSRPTSRSRSPYLYERERDSNNSSTELDPNRVEEYLQQNPDFLQNYISRYIEQETIESWIDDRQKTATRRKSSLSKWKYGSQADKVLLQDLVTSLRNNSPEGCVLWELATCIQNAVSADSFTLYMVDSSANTLKKYANNTNENDVAEYNIEDGTTMAAYVANRQQPQRLPRVEAAARFPEALGESSDGNNASYILCHPILRIDGSLLGVLELHRLNADVPFYVDDEEVVHSYLVWGGIALHYAEINTVMSKSKTLNEFLLQVVKSIFQDIVSMDTLIKKIMNFAQKLVDADRASLFLLDTKNQELYARLFDMGGSLELVTTGGENTTLPAKEIRFPLGTGIAGQVAATGMVLNIKDAYADERFNRSVDKLTGYLTKTILCMPVFIRSTVIGVVQMVNKKSGIFTKDDEEAFQTFAVYCGLALHHAKLYDKIRRSEQKFKVALEVLSYHNVCNISEFNKFKEDGYPRQIIGLDDYYFAPSSIDDDQKVHYTIYMFVDLFGLNRFEVDGLYKFFLTVRKNYRKVPYHNWTHGFTVGHSAYCILKKSSVFRPLECLAMYVSAVCHDLDHRGKNNKFMLDTASPLASIYTTSTLEHHHFNQTVTILQQDGHNIFSKLSSEEYKQVLGNIKHCILATDLAAFFPNRKKLQGFIDDEKFSWGSPDHRLLVEAVAMTAADLCASTKPWEAQKETVKVIFEEFYEQGDLEKEAGRTPIPMMDRDKLDEQPASQVGFLSGICLPCYSTLNVLIPETNPMLEGVVKNLDRWKLLAEQQRLIKEEKESNEATSEDVGSKTTTNGESESSTNATEITENGSA